MKIIHNIFLLKDTSCNYTIFNFHEILLLTKGDISISWWTFPKRNDASESKNSNRF